MENAPVVLPRRKNHPACPGCVHRRPCKAGVTAVAAEDSRLICDDILRQPSVHHHATVASGRQITANQRPFDETLVEAPDQLIETEWNLEAAGPNFGRPKPPVIDGHVSPRVFFVSKVRFDLIFEVVEQASLDGHAGAAEDEFVFTELRIEIAGIEMQPHAESGAELADAKRGGRKLETDVRTRAVLLPARREALRCRNRRNRQQERDHDETTHQSPFLGVSHETDFTPAVPLDMSCALRSSRERFGSTATW